MYASVLFALTACNTTPDTAPEAVDSPAPSFMEPTSAHVDGNACTWNSDSYSTNAGLLLSERWTDIGSLTVAGATYTSADQITQAFEGGTEFENERLALALNLALDDAGVFGMYADLQSAVLMTGPLQGTTAPAILREAMGGPSHDLEFAVSAFNDGFGGCNYTWYLIDGSDVDNDGVINTEDCDDTDPSIGGLIYEDDLDSDDGIFEPTDELGDDWSWDGTSAVATDGGQEGMLAGYSGDDYVVIGSLTAQGTEPACGFDCLQTCVDYAPEDDCWTDYQALALGILSFEITGTGVATLSNSDPDYDICLEGFAMWDLEGSQSLVVGEDVLAGETYRIDAGSQIDLYYGSWTTDNGVYSPYLDDPAFWCYQYGTVLQTGDAYSSIGAWLPEDMQAWVTDDTDTDGDGTEDHVDWAGGSGVQAQHNIWEYQETHAAVAIGKLAESSSSGTVEVTLTVQNRGAESTTASVTDTLPPSWSLVSCDDTPDSETGNDDDTTTLSWEVALDGCQNECSIVDEHVITCDISYNLNTDLNFVDLPSATADYNDGDDDETSESMPAAAFDYDWDSDGQILCGETERWRAGFLGRAELDGDQDEGFHGYRCALAHNSEYECWPGGHFLQIAAFLDVEEDDIQSECDGECENPSFDQLSRQNHDGDIDLSAGDDAELRFWLVGDDLHCSADDGNGNTVETAATATYFDEGSSGMSTLNMYGDFDNIKVCEAFGLPTDEYEEVGAESEDTEDEEDVEE
ncbi:MAG: DUF11 domain-containing protein [Proteobacteria bacterium]|nr:DUF11 domain-containing protein [Pseudomonadota bacterium]MCP4915711.1 DUF11 domain-containing protein [Pseudomonadota bacterium]